MKLRSPIFASLAGLIFVATGFAENEAAVDFESDIRPLLEANCLSCHNEKKADGGLILETRATALTGGDSGPVLVPGEPDESLLYLFTTLDEDADELMPPGEPLGKEQIEQLRQWIVLGAKWPEDVKLMPKAKIRTGPKTTDDIELVKKIHALVVQRAAEDKDAETADYSATVPKTGAAYHMVAIEGGVFLMGSSEGESYREETEGPQVKVKVDPFWIGKCEVTWDEYEPFMITQVDRSKDGARTDFDPQVHTIVDAVSQPTAPYTEMSFGMGQKGYPAISMTQHAANKYCEWLSAQTGHFYRLPTEAEWEYACRAGTTTAYSFGDDPAQLGEYAWFYDNAYEKYRKVGTKKPNPWGLHDMHGNVMEWTADQYVPDYLARIKDEADNPFLKPETLYPRTVRGGGWDDDPEHLRSAYRRCSDPTWKQQDPQLPRSIWYHTNAQWLGFRIVRPLEIPTVDEMYFYWNSAANKL